MPEWLSRKRTAASIAAPSTTTDSKPVSFSNLPLDWTKLNSCQIKKQKRQPNGASLSEELQRLNGKAVFFLHDANSDLRDSNEDDGNRTSGDVDGEVNNLTWFQGRFFPSTMIASSPTSITASLSSNYVSKSWGLLGVQKHVQDECLRCSEGGYRELVLTFIRHINTGVGAKRKAIRWKSKDLTWTGGDMMRLSSDYALRDNETGVKFEPNMLIDGPKALEIGRKYFPKLTNQLLDGQNKEDVEALVVIGTMEVVLPVEFVRKGNGIKMNVKNEDDDVLWSD